jgi:hypothetical protein
VGSVALDMPPLPIQGGRINPAEMLANMNYRSVYLPVFRNELPDALDAFDFADPSMVSGARDVTTVPPQALYMLNNEFVTGHAQGMATRLTHDASVKTDGARVELAYRLALGRSPTSSERDRAMNFLNSYARDPAMRNVRVEKVRIDAWASFCQALFASAEFRYLN